MVRLGNGGDVVKLLRRVADCPSTYAVVMISSPFIDDTMQDELLVVGRRMSKTSGALKIVTRLAAASRLRQKAIARGLRDSVRIFAVDHLHAKIYLAVGRSRSTSLAVVTSANLTVSGTTRQIEVGTVATPTSPVGERLVNTVRTTFSHLTERPPRGTARCVL